MHVETSQASPWVRPARPDAVVPWAWEAGSLLATNLPRWVTLAGRQDVGWGCEGCRPKCVFSLLYVGLALLVVAAAKTEPGAFGLVATLCGPGTESGVAALSVSPPLSLTLPLSLLPPAPFVQVAERLRWTTPEDALPKKKLQ